MAPNPLHIAIFSRDLNGGGVQKILVNLAQYWSEKDFKVDLVLSRAEGSFLDLVPASVRIIDLKGAEMDRRKSFKLPTSLSSTTSLPKLVSYLRKERPQGLLAASHYSNEIAILAKYLARVPTRIVISEHTTLSIEAKRVEQLSARIAPIMARLLYPGADGIVTVSDGVATDLAKITKIPLKRIKTIYNPVITPELLTQANEPVDHPWFTSRELPIILGAGRFVKQKDFPTLIKAFAQVQSIKPCRLVILGSGREQKNLQLLIKEMNLEEKVAMPGFVNNPYAYMAKASVFALSSAWEGLSTVLVEALAVGTPVVSTNCESGPAEILDQGKYGELVPVGDDQAMAEAILRVLSGQNKTVPSTWLNQFTLEAASQNYYDILIR